MFDGLELESVAKTSGSKGLHLFLLPHTGPDGAQVMAKRVQQMAVEKNLTDVVGDRLEAQRGELGVALD